MPHRLRVLFVDDDPRLLAALVRLLRSESTLRITTATSVDAALAVLSRTPIDVVVTDQIMPGRTGSELLSEIAQQYPRTRRILLTGSRRGAGPISAQVVLDKPCSREVLLAAIYAKQEPHY